MTMLRLKGVHRFRDRYGKVRYYFRRRGEPAHPLPGEPGSQEFMAAYNAARDAAKPPAGRQKSPPGSISALIVAYYASTDFKGLADSTQTVYRNILERFRAEWGLHPASFLERQHIKAMMAKRAGPKENPTPEAANSWLKRIRRLMRFALDMNLIKEDPTAGIRRMPVRSAGFHTWTEGEIAKFEAHHPPGSPARLAFALLLYTGQRRADVVTMGRQHVRGGVISIRQQKTGRPVDIPIHSALKAVLDDLPKERLTFLLTGQGKPFTAAGFGNWFRDRCNEAELPAECSAHGLRKAAARRLAEAGCTAHEIAAITGHGTLSEIERYTRAANRIGLADAAIKKIDPGTRLHKLKPPSLRKPRNNR